LLFQFLLRDLGLLGVASLTVGFCLAILGLYGLSQRRSSGWFRGLLASAAVPAAIGVGATILARQAVAGVSAEVSPVELAQGRARAWNPMWAGGAAAAPILAIGIIGLRQHLQRPTSN
jgi:hypothetical protein